MKEIIIYSNDSLYRDNFVIKGYEFGKGKNSICIVGNTRGDEYQQLYICSKLVDKLRKLEDAGGILDDNKILIIPSCNPSSMNIEKRFWPIDNTDINRMFPGYDKGETTQRIANKIFEVVKEYPIGIQFPSFYIPGKYTPHVLIMKTQLEYTELAKDFGLPYVVIREPRPYDTTTLNFNWQIWNTQAFSIYSTTTKTIDYLEAKRSVNAVLNFMDHQKIIKFKNHHSFVSVVLSETESIESIRADEAGFFIPNVEVEKEVLKGQKLADIVDTTSGRTKSSLYAPCDGIAFYLTSKPIVLAHESCLKLIKS